MHNSDEESSALFRNRASIYRLSCNITISIFSQWAGNGAISYFISAVLTNAGVTNEITQLNINLGLNCMQFALALVGAGLVDRVGRRPLLLFANIGVSIVWIGAIIASANNAKTQSAPSGAGVVAMIFLFDAIFSVGYTPLQALYPVEVLSFEMRAKGMAFSNFATSAGEYLLTPPPTIVSNGSLITICSYVGQPIRLPNRTQENHMEDVHRLRHLVSHPGIGDLLLHPRDQEPHSKTHPASPRRHAPYPPTYPY